MSACIRDTVAEIRQAAGKNTSLVMHLPEDGTLIWIGPDEEHALSVIVAAGAEVAQHRARERQQRPPPCSD